MSFRNMLKVIASLAMLAVLAGCTVTGEPRMGNVAFDKEGYVAQNNFQKSISVGEVSNFPGTSKFTYGGKLAPNFSNDSFKEALELSLKNVNLYGKGYNLDAVLVDSGDWSDWFELSLGNKSRKIQIKYSLNTELVSSDIIGTSAPAIYDSNATIVSADGKSIVLYIWYDNEYGYSHQVIRLAKHVAKVRRYTYY